MKFLITLIKLPFLLLSIFTSAKSFRDNPIIGSSILNRLGLHTIRVKLAHAITRLRWFMLSPLMPKHLRQQYHEDGFVIIPDFITAEDIASLHSEIAKHQGPVRQLTQGDTATQRILLDTPALKGNSALAALCKNSALKRYLSYCGAKIMPPLLYIQRIRNGHRKGKADPQKNMHSDTFHSTMKAWLFLQDVTEEAGPFTYVKGSHHFSALRRAWEYERSISAATMQDRYSEKGSMRVDPDDLAAMNLPDPIGVTVKAGTLVIANTNGFHGRGQAANGASRLEIWAYSRHNPFNPFPGLSIPGMANIRHVLMQKYLSFKDAQAKKRNGKASWHLIPAEEMLDDLNKSIATLDDLGKGTENNPASKPKGAKDIK